MRFLVNAIFYLSRDKCYSQFNGFKPSEILSERDFAKFKSEGVGYSGLTFTSGEFEISIDLKK